MSVQTFISEIAPIIKREASARGYKVCSTVIAQAIIESRYGESVLGSKYHNYFGLKCGSFWKGASVNMKTKEEYTVGNLTTISDNFRVYSDMASGVAGYYNFISTKRYSALKTAANYAEYANILKSAGYATSSSYVNTLTKTVNAYNLTVYDDPSAAIPNHSVNGFIVGKTYTTNTNLYIRLIPGGDKLEMKSLTTNAQINAYTDADGFSVLKKGTRVTCKDVKSENGKTWIRIPSGWICGIENNKIYVD